MNNKASKMINMRGRINKNGELVLQQGKSDYQASEFSINLTISIDINDLISGINGFVWATKHLHQAEIIANALKVQRIELEIMKFELDNNVLYLIQITRKKDLKEVIDFIQNDKGGLRLKPDWKYPPNKPNESFEQWINE